MRTLRGKRAIVTGAAGGLGVHLARSLGQAGVRVMLTDLPGTRLAEVSATLQREGLETAQVAVDLTAHAGRETLLQAALDWFGAVDILVNNAGAEFSAIYHELSADRIERVIAVNLVAAMLLTHRVLPDMVRRRSGHVVNLGSLAGKAGAGFQEPYAATKAGLVAFTHSLRGTYQGTGVSASVICPGFVETGIYARLKAVAGRAAPSLLGACSPEKVAQAMLRALRRDLAEVILNRYPVRPMLALAALFPCLGCRMVSWLGVNDFFRAVALAERSACGKPASAQPDSAQPALDPPNQE
jgi:short-subunit dehydrogenase